MEANRSKLRAKGITVLEEPKGRPMFQFFLARGKTKPVMTFMDSGCSDAIFREGIPAVQWEGAVSKAGPFDLGGVGGLAAFNLNETTPLSKRSAETEGFSITSLGIARLSSRCSTTLLDFLQLSQ